MALLRAGGVTVWVGLHEAGSDVDRQAMIRFEKLVTGSFCYDEADFAAAIPLARLVDEAWLEPADLSTGVSVFDRLRGAPSRFIKTILIP
ncbi:hypothetical protein KZZ52_14850 [Dactylosporangium sp. AC04546]|nr:hypothetical protein KZZ52_14850 [Dactylosporangium sp. AC04546]